MAKKQEKESNYSVTIIECSKELSAKERIAFKDTSDALKLDQIISDNEPLIIAPADYAILAVHNEKADNVDYEVYVIVDKDNQKYATGSSNFFNSFKNIFDEMANESEDWELKCYKRDSKNYSGKKFITCSIV